MTEPSTSPATLARQLVDAYNHHDLVAYRDLHATGSRVEFAGDGDIALESWLSSLATLFTAMPDLTVEPVTLIADEASVVLELRHAGTHTGVLALDDGARALLETDIDHVPPTGRDVEALGVVVLRITDGVVAHERHHWPHHWIYEALGLLTPTLKET